MRGRRSHKTRDERITDLQQAINRSSFTGLEVLQILVDWLQWEKIEVSVGHHIKHEFTGTTKLLSERD